VLPSSPGFARPDRALDLSFLLLPSVFSTMAAQPAPMAGWLFFRRSSAACLPAGFEAYSIRFACLLVHSKEATANLVSLRVEKKMATNDKYDRQLRLWGASGQRALSETCAVLVGGSSSAAGTETVKNLVLPGVGSFVVVDDEQHQQDDGDHDGREYESNFFLVRQEDGDGGGDHNSTGSSSTKKTKKKKKSRPEIAAELLRELNPDVRGEFRVVPDLSSTNYVELFESIASENRRRTTSPSSSQQLLVVASDLEPPAADAVAAACEELAVKLVVVQSYGWIGTVRVQCPPMPLLQPKPRDAPPDLRLVRPFPELQRIAFDEEAPSSSFDDLDSRQHGHVPYPVILLKLQHEYKSDHGGKLPETLEEKRRFAESVRKASRDFDKELNFQEAERNAYLAYTERALDADHLSRLQEQLLSNDNNNAKNNTDCAVFLALLRGLDAFLQKNDGNPPLQRTIPDMHASTEWYVKLQRAYRDRADRDVAELRKLVPTDLVPDDVLETFARNVFALDLYRPRSWSDEHLRSSSSPPDPEIVEDLAMATMEGDERPDQLPLLWYLGVQACRMFFLELGGRYPGTIEESWEADVPLLQQCLARTVRRYGLQDVELVQQTLLSPTKGEDYAHELCRMGDAELHNVASVVGGVASQEAVKLVTGQYVPIDNTFVYNGIASTGGVYRF